MFHKHISRDPMKIGEETLEGTVPTVICATPATTMTEYVAVGTVAVCTGVFVVFPQYTGLSCDPSFLCIALLYPGSGSWCGAVCSASLTAARS